MTSKTTPSIYSNLKQNIHLGIVGCLILASAFRLFVTDRNDRYRCHALLNQGDWLDESPHSNWQPNGCMLHKYAAKEVESCLTGRHVVFLGDSTTRQTYYAAVKAVDPSASTVADKHSDRSISTNGGTRFDFIWDPFLNSSKLDDLLQHRFTGVEASSVTVKPALLVLGGGLWFLRQNLGIKAWQDAVDRVFRQTSYDLADEIIVQPVEYAIEPLLTGERARTIHNSDIEKMNAYLLERDLQSGQSLPGTISVPWAFNKMVANQSLETDDGLHFSDKVVRAQADILFNFRCNDEMTKKFPVDKTCCASYPTANYGQILFFVLLLALAPASHYAGQRVDMAALSAYLPGKEYLPSLVVFSLALLLIYLGDRTPLFLRSSKQYDNLHMALLSFFAIAAGLATLKRSDKGDLGFMNREQTDEWKGWMQLAILIYHYLGASQISAIYNPIRAMVAAYLFMTGYGHFFFYYKKADYSFNRVFSVLVRLNLLPVCLAYTMDTDWLSYYFSPLVTMWFAIIWVTMYLGYKWNSNLRFMLVKLALSAASVAAFFKLNWPLQQLFDLSNKIFATEWIAKEWGFRVTLDLYIVYGGMLAALLFIKISEHHLTDRPWWPAAVKYTIWAASLILVGYSIAEVQFHKFVYNTFHPYVSVLPVAAFAIARNATPYLRSVNSTFFGYFGRCSLETFIIQFHLWMAADTKGLLTYIPGTTLLPRTLNFCISTFIFVHLSEIVATATGKLTELICGKTPAKPLPRSAKLTPDPRSETATTSYVSLPMKDDKKPDTTQSPSHLRAFSESMHVGQPSQPAALWSRMTRDPRLRFLAILLTLWAFNMIYPTDKPPQGHLLPTH